MDIVLRLDLTESPGLTGKRRSEVFKIIREFNGRSIPLKVTATGKVGDIGVENVILLPFAESDRDSIIYTHMKRGQKEIELEKTFEENGLKQGSVISVYAMVK